MELPEDAYQGMDIVEHAKAFAAENGDRYVDADAKTRRDALVAYALPKNIEGLKRDLGKYRIQYDTWFRESTLHADGSVMEIVRKLRDSGYTYEQDGATWFKATEFGADKDFVLVRSNGIPTYVVPDIAYHYNKLVTRGFDKAGGGSSRLCAPSEGGADRPWGGRFQAGRGADADGIRDAERPGGKAVQAQRQGHYPGDLAGGDPH